MLIYLGDVSLSLIDYLTNFFLFKLHEDADTWREKVESASAVSGESAMVRDSDVNWEYLSSKAVDSLIFLIFLDINYLDYFLYRTHSPPPPPPGWRGCPAAWPASPR